MDLFSFISWWLKLEITQIQIKTTKREEIIDITKKIEDIIKDSDVKNGICRVFVPHTTAGITINENADNNVKVDVLDILKQLIPQSGAYRHIEGNSDSHLKASLMGPSQTILIRNGQLLLGTWQGLWFCEFDGPRARSVIVSVEKFM
ncbi:MAG: secondary thiamine-phosphate synthase enzyme YjbQ [Candidatus Helarchaeota archaeon]